MELLQLFCDSEGTIIMSDVVEWEYGQILSDIAESSVSHSSCYVNNKYLKNLSHRELAILLCAAKAFLTYKRREKGISSLFG